MKNKLALFILVTLTLFSTNLFSQNALHFDGIDDKVDCGNGTSLRITGTSITIESWIYPTTWGANVYDGTIISKDGGIGVKRGYNLRVGAGGKMSFVIGDSVEWRDITTANSVLSLNSWQHIAATYDGQKIRLYVNGVITDSLSNSSPIANVPGTNMIIGAHPTLPRFFTGQIDEVRIWNVCRSASEIALNKNKEFCSTTNGLVAYYKFSQGDAGQSNTNTKTAYDLSGNKNHGTLSAFTLAGSSSNWVNGKILAKSKSYGTETLTACNLYKSPSGKYTWYQSGIYTDTINTVEYACDSIITYNLTILKGSSSTIFPVSCKDYTSPSGDYTWYKAGTYYDKIKNYLNCDSLITIVLRFGGSIDSINVTACNSYKSATGKIRTASGRYVDTAKDQYGCDSIIILNLKIKKSSVGTFQAKACRKYISPSGKYTWTKAGIYKDTVKNYINCDSIITITLEIKSSSSNININACKQVKSPSGKRTWTVSGIYKDTIFNVLGCDSLMTINLTINQPTIGSKTVSACQSYRGEGKKRLWIKSGVYKDTLINANGCDSVLTVNLTIININTNVTQTTNTLTAVKPTGTYQWLNCNTSMSEVPAATNRVFNVKTSGNYAVEITDSGCVDTSTCYNVNVVSVNRLNKNNTFKIIPNPNNGVFDIQLPTECYNAIIKVRDISGRLVFEQSFDQLKQSHLQLDNIQTSGLYVIEIVSPGFSAAQYIAIER